MIILSLDKESKTPLFKQVISQLKEKIDTNILKPGDKLPATRTFSTQLGVNRSTIYKAYQELWALGYIESKSGSYSYVRNKRITDFESKISSQNFVDWSKRTNPTAEKVIDSFGDIGYPFSEKFQEFDGIDFSRLHPDSRIFPIDTFRKCLSKVISKSGKIIFDYGETKGYAPLREYIAHRLRLHGISISAEEIILTNGAQNGIDLLLKLFAKPGARVFVESPTYGMIIPTIKFYGCEIVPIPMKKDGIDLNVIETEFKKGLPIFLYTMPNFHNPTGITTNQKHREKLISLFEKYHVPIIEDAFEEEMKYFGKVPLPIKSMDISQIVFYIGSFSKILFPGIRIGWIAANKECINRLSILKRFSDISSVQPEQAALAEFCNQGLYELHIKRIHKIYRKRMLVAIQEVEKKIINKNIDWVQPNGGFTIWLTLKNLQLSYDEINQTLHSHKIRVALGKDFYPNGEEEKHIRIAISTLDEEEIVKGMHQLALALKELYKRNKIL